MKFVAWYCRRCRMHFRESELRRGKCPECGGAVTPRPMETKEEAN